MGVFRLAKVIASLPGSLIRDTFYAVRTGAGFNLFLSDATGTVAHPLNIPNSLPAGGVSGQLLTKQGTTDYAATWGVKVTVGPTQPASPAVGDLWVDTN